MKRIVAIFVLFCAVLPGRAAVFPADSSALVSGSASVSGSTAAAAEPVCGSAEVFRPSRLIVPGVVFTAGAVGVGWDWYIDHINIPLKDYAAGLREEYGSTKIDNWIQYAPAAAYFALGAFGAGTHDFREHLIAGAGATATLAILNNAIKYTVCEMRPDGSTRNSFPSGHSGTAFMGAELVRLEYGGWAGAGAYAVATATALLRVYNNRHWFCDLLGGAALGVLSARAGYWLLPYGRRILDRWFGSSGSGGGSGSGSDSGSDVSVAIVPFAAPLSSFGAASSPFSASESSARGAVTPFSASESSFAASPSAYGLSVALIF